MAYSVYISRGERYSDDFAEITMDEWKAFIDKTEELFAIEMIEATNPSTGEVIRIQTPNSAQHKTDKFVLSWRNGSIETKYHEDILDLIRSYAKKLGAKVYGEEGEVL